MSAVLSILDKNKFYLKNTDVVEQLASIDTIVFDKTGTVSIAENLNIIFKGNLDDEILAFREKVKYLRKGNGHIRIANVVLLDSDGEKISEIEFGQYFTIRIFFQVFENLTEAIIAFYIKDKNQIEIVDLRGL